MATVTFDTLKFVKTLEAAGVPVEQAEALASAVRDSHDAAEVATKADLRELRAEMRELEQRLVIRVGTMLAIAVGVLAAIIKL